MRNNFSRFASFILLIFILLGYSILLVSSGNAQLPGFTSRFPQVAVADEPCALPTVTNGASSINVRSGPGTEYPVQQLMRSGESYLIIGRAETRRYWLIELATGQSGWVFNDIVTVNGNISNTPLVEPPLINGEPILPGASWTPQSNSPPCLIIVTPEVVTETASAQETAELLPTAAEGPYVQSYVPWKVPLNLSNSGSGIEPQIVLDINKNVHVIWQEPATNSYRYATRQNGSWIASVSTELPFGTRRFAQNLLPSQPTPLYIPQLVTDKMDGIHAFWLEQDQALYYSSVTANNFANFDLWQPRQELTGAALAYAAVISDDGRIHVAYVRHEPSLATATGLYYTQSSDSGMSWTEPTLIYESPYFRSQSASDVSIDITHSGETIWLAWDNRSLEKVLLVHSLDNGNSWQSIRTVDERQVDDLATVAGPSKLSVVAAGQDVHLLWNSGHGETFCNVYHQWSVAGGSVWEAAEALTSIAGCSKYRQTLITPEGSLYVLALDEVEARLSAWNNGVWSEPQLQGALSTFLDPVTFRPNLVGCHAPIFADTETLLVVGCSQSQDEQQSRQDIWLFERTLDDIASWFPAPPLWSPPEIVSADAVAEDPILLTDDEGIFHAFWIQADASGLSNNTSIYYASLVDNRWSRPAPILATPSENLTALMSEEGHFVLVWHDPELNSLMMSRTTIDAASIPTYWSTPRAFNEIPLHATDPQLVAAEAGEILLLFAIPINEQQGLYLQRSIDNGLTWSEPIQVIDAVDYDWSVVGRPRLTITHNDTMHIIWQHSNLAGQVIELFYVRSEDDGLSWSTPDLVVKGAVIWSDIIAVSEQILFRFGQEISNGETSLWYQQSINDGMEWDNTVQLRSFASLSGQTMTVLDPAGKAYLIQITTSEDDVVFRSWQWQGLNWRDNGNQFLDNRVLAINNMAAAINFSGKLVTLYGANLLEETDSVLPNALYANSRELEINANSPALATARMATPTDEPTVTTQPGLTATPETNSTIDKNPPSNGNSKVTLLIQALPVGFILVVTLIIGLRIMSRTRQ